MRVGFRILIYKDGKRLKRTDLKDYKEAFWIGVRYITEFKYLEATKWLLVSEDSYEKYLLLALIHTSFGQRETAQEFIREGMDKPKRFKIKVEIDNPETGVSMMIDSFEDINKLHGGRL